jgi:hypothetical protein
MDRRNQILSTNRPSGETMSKLPLVIDSPHKKERNPLAISCRCCPTRGAAPFSTNSKILSTNTRIGCQRNKTSMFVKQTVLFVVPVFFFGGAAYIINFPLLFPYPYFYPLHFLSFSCVTIHSSPSNYSFCPFSSTLSPCLHLPSYPSPTRQHITPPSNTFTTHWPAYYTDYISPAHCNPWQKNPPLQQLKYTQTHTRTSSPHTTSPTHPTSLIPPPLLAPPLPVTQVSTSS